MESSGHEALISAVVIARNEAATLGSCLTAARHALDSVGGGEILLVDSASSDGTREIGIEAGCRVLTVRKASRFSPSAMRWIGAGRTRSRYILFLDGDCVLEADFLQEALRVFGEDASMGVVAGTRRDLYLTRKGIVPAPVEYYRPSNGGSSRPAYGGCALYRSRALREAGSFDPFLRAKEEEDLANRIIGAGYRIEVLSRQMISHLTVPRESPQRLMRTLNHGFFVGRGQAARLFLARGLFASAFRGLDRVLLLLAHTALGAACAFAAWKSVWWPAWLWVALSFAGFALFVMKTRSLSRATYYVAEWAVQGACLFVGFLLPWHPADRFEWVGEEGRKGTGSGTPAAVAGRPPRRWIFVTWYPYCRRSDALGKQLGAPSYLVHYFRFKAPLLAPFKYVLQALKTALILLRERPDGVLVANPPVTAPLVIWLGSLILRYRFIVDAHSGAFQHTLWRWSLPLQRFVARRALATVVTNAHMADEVRSWGGRAELVQDLALDLDPAGESTRQAGFHVVFICTYSIDEPVDAVLEAARRLPEVRFSFTGDPSYAGRETRKAVPPNVRLTGFMPDREYLALLRGADAIMSLTLEDHTMQRGGYEAVALEKPLITSDWPLLREVFSRGAVHVDNSPESIVAAVRTIQEAPVSFRADMAELKRIRAEVAAVQGDNLRRLCQGRLEGGTRA